MRKVQVLSDNQEVVAHHTLYGPSRVTEAYTPHKPQRGGNSPLKATLVLTGLALFMAAATTVMVARTWNFYDALHISGWQSYVVQAGDTVSSLAAKFDPQDYQGTVQQAIEKENHMVGSTIRAGEVLQVPVVGRKLP